jgi:hypothetical protein
MSSETLFPGVAMITGAAGTGDQPHHQLSTQTSRLTPHINNYQESALQQQKLLPQPDAPK